jgi:hypothetical protein
VSCQNNQESIDIDTTEDTSSLIDNTVYNQKVKKMFHSIPAPMEMIHLIQSSGIEFNQNLLNDPKNESKYLSTSQVALNMGIYGADLSYCRILEQVQESVNYLITIQKISKKLHIPEEEGNNMLSNVEAHLDNRDSVIQIITKSYSNTDTYLKENGQANVAALILIGGWIEGMYIAFEAQHNAIDSNMIKRRLAEQKLSFNNLMDLMSDFKDDSTIVHFQSQFEAIKKEYDKIKINVNTNAVEVDTINQFTTIEAASEVTFSNENLEAIRKIISDIRKEIIQ